MTYEDKKRALGIPLTLTAIDTGFKAETPDTINKESAYSDVRRLRMERGKHRPVRPFTDLSHMNPGSGRRDGAPKPKAKR